MLKVRKLPPSFPRVLDVMDKLPKNFSLFINPTLLSISYDNLD